MALSRPERVPRIIIQTRFLTNRPEPALGRRAEVLGGSGARTENLKANFTSLEATPSVISIQPPSRSLDRILGSTSTPFYSSGPADIQPRCSGLSTNFTSYRFAEWPRRSNENVVVWENTIFFSGPGDTYADDRGAEILIWIATFRTRRSD